MVSHRMTCLATDGALTVVQEPPQQCSWTNPHVDLLTAFLESPRWRYCHSETDSTTTSKKPTNQQMLAHIRRHHSSSIGDSGTDWHGCSPGGRACVANKVPPPALRPPPPPRIVHGVCAQVIESGLLVVPKQPAHLSRTVTDVLYACMMACVLAGDVHVAAHAH
jgi:hypothetical protein